MCNAQMGLTGNDCRDLCSEGKMTLAFDIILTIIGIFAGTTCIYFLYRNYQRKSAARYSLPVLFTLVFAGSGLFLFGIERILASITSVGYRDFSVVMELPSGRLIRRTTQASMETLYLFFGFAACFGTCSLFLLPLAWVRSQKVWISPETYMWN